MDASSRTIMHSEIRCPSGVDVHTLVRPSGPGRTRPPALAPFDTIGDVPLARPSPVEPVATGQFTKRTLAQRLACAKPVAVRGSG
ncbi:MAG: hypothetical protein EBS89_03570 [Proteobacteria bacterium]|nr:hypothetical protein [Pseudomonadota bacterium]